MEQIAFASAAGTAALIAAMGVGILAYSFALEPVWERFGARGVLFSTLFVFVLVATALVIALVLS